MNIYNDIRQWDGSKNRAFEELITQMAMQSSPIEADFFATHGKGGDGGVDCFCVLKNGKKWGWQAKFINDLSLTSLNQIDKSIKTAFDTHPELVKYFVCVPFNRTTKKKGKGKSEIEKWSKKIKQWEQYAKNVEVHVRINFIGESEIVKFLQKPENKGILYFWFNKLEFTEKWFENHVEEMKKNANARYTPKLNIELEISEIFEGLGRTREFIFFLKKESKELRERFNDFEYILFRFGIKNKIKKVFDALKKNTVRINSILDNVRTDPTKIIDYESVKTHAKDSYELIENLKGEINKDTIIVKKSELSDEYSDFRYYSNRLADVYQKLVSLSKSLKAKASNEQCIFLKGEWGTGKTHLFCDLMENRLARGYSSFILFGQKLTGSSIQPSSFLKDSLDIKANTFEEIFGAFDALGKIFDGRVILFIDALNEGKGKEYWINHIVDIRTKLARYPNLALALSCRTSYEDCIKPTNLNCIDVIHTGFGEQTFDAMTSYFSYYNIQFPTIPLLSPEFSKPMFLKIFCEGLSKANMRSLPSGLTGINQIFNLYLQSVEKQLNSKLQYLPQNHFVFKAVDALVEEMLKADCDYIEYNKAYKIIEGIRPSANDRESLFFGLLSEGVITEIKSFRDFNEIRFSYDRFSDYLKVKYILDKLETANIGNAFKQGGKFYFLIKNKNHYKYQGIIEALTIALPEKYNLELFELLKYDEKDSIYVLYEPFLQSLVWREKNKITEKTVDYFTNIMKTSEYWYESSIETLLAISTIPNHKLDVFWLHERLIKLEMSKRDLSWSFRIHKLFGSNNSVDRIVQWSIKVKDISHYEDDVILNASVVLSWFLTNSNRELRDKATKGLINILKNKIDLLIRLLCLFESINDLYVLERLYCVSYGCVLFNKSKKDVLELSNYVYEKQFLYNKPIPHILIRDYARQIVEYSINLGVNLRMIKIKNIKPPYKSPKITKIPSDNIWNKYDYRKGYGDIHSSLSSMGDFSRYILGSNTKKFFLNRNFLIRDAAKWIFKKVLDYGWEPQLFEKIERDYFNNYYSRTEHQVERIGKKYQWIAYYELCARVLDNYSISNDTYDWEESDYRGPWQYWIRNIDPSNILYCEKNEKLKKYKWEPKYQFPLKIDKKWMNEKNDIPEPSKLLSFYDDESKKKYINLEMLWMNKNEEEYEINDNTVEVWLWIRSFFVNKNDTKKILDYFKRNRSHRELDPIHHRNAFLGEHFWCDSIEYKTTWERTVEIDGKFPVPIVQTTSEYSWGDDFDYSRNYVNSCYIPSSWFAEKAKLRWCKCGFGFADTNNEIVCFDPSTLIENNFVLPKKKSAFLVEYEFISKFLRKNNLDLFWIVFGEKIFCKHILPSNPFGRLIIDGVYHFNGNKLDGNFSANLESW